MKLTPDVALVGSGSFGFDLTSPADAHLYLIDGGDELALIDAGCGDSLGNTDLILRNIRDDGYSTDRISNLILTHYHFDHVGGAAEVHDALGIPVHASPLTARVLETGDEDTPSLTAEKDRLRSRRLQTPSLSVIGDLVEGTTFNIGRLTVTVSETPGHCDGHVSLLVEGGDRPTLIQGDVVFAGGTILLQSIPDCSLENYRASVQKLAALNFDAFFPGHGMLSLRNGKRHVDLAAATFANLGVPKNLG